MANLVLEGFPQNTKVSKLVVIFKGLLKKESIPKFWIKDMADIRGTNLKSVTVEFPNMHDSQRALDAFQRFQYRDGKNLYSINSYLDEQQSPTIGNWDNLPSKQDTHSGKQRLRRYSPNPYRRRNEYDDIPRHRSPSPYGSSQLDMELELLKKQRMIIEEERRLLLERKKLELVKEFGPSALQEFESSERSRERYRDYKRGPSPTRSRPQKRPKFERPPTPPRKFPNPSRKLPNFLWPVKIILKDMKELIDGCGVEVGSEEMTVLYKMIRITLRKRLAVLCEGKPIMAAPELAALYRERYPTSLDEAFVSKHFKDLKSSHMTLEPGTEKGKKKAEPKGTKVKGETSAQTEKPKSTEDKKEDTKAPKVDKEDNVTDTATNLEDIKIETIKTEEDSNSNEKDVSKDTETKTAENTSDEQKSIPIKNEPNTDEHTIKEEQNEEIITTDAVKEKVPTVEENTPDADTKIEPKEEIITPVADTGKQLKVENITSDADKDLKEEKITPDADTGKQLKEEKITPDAEKIKPDAEKITPDAEKITPDAEKTTPDAEKITPDAEKTTSNEEPVNTNTVLEYGYDIDYDRVEWSTVDVDADYVIKDSDLDEWVEDGEGWN